MQPRETLLLATIEFFKEVDMVIKALVTDAPWYRRLFMDDVHLKWLSNRQSVCVNLYSDVRSCCDLAVENDYAIDMYAVHVVARTNQLIDQLKISFICDDHLETLHRTFMRGFSKYVNAVNAFNQSNLT